MKQDGFRAVVYLQNGECKILSRNFNQLRFKSLRAVLAKLPALDAILNGEIVCLDARGVSRFNLLLNKKSQSVFYAFDLLWLNGEDLRQEPLIEQKQRLSVLVRKCDRIIRAQHVEKDGKDLFQEICAQDLDEPDFLVQKQ